MQHTFLLADLAGFTALTEAHGDKMAADVAEEFARAMRELLVEHTGEEVKRLGDGVLLRLDRAADALRLAAKAVSDLGGRHGALGVRIGMHTGPAVSRGDDWFGATVNLAARVAGEAGRAEVLLTAATRDAADAGLDGFGVRSLGRRRLRNLSEAIELFALVLAEDGCTDMALDPVCRMAVDPDHPHDQVRHAGETHVFCSSSCAALFRASPERFVH